MTPTKTAPPCEAETWTPRLFREDRAAVEYLAAEIDDLEIARLRRCSCHHCLRRIHDIEEQRRLTPPRMGG